MAFNINRVTICGRLGTDAEHRSFQNGGGVVNLRVATSETWKDKQTGEKKERSDWHTVAIFAKWLIDDARKLRKGDMVMVEGKLQTRKWQDSGGNDRYSTEVVLQGMDSSLFKMAARERQGGDQGDQERGSGASGSNGGWGSGGTSGGGSGGGSYGDGLDDDIPF